MSSLRWPGVRGSELLTCSEEIHTLLSTNNLYIKDPLPHVICIPINPSNAEATFFLSTWTHIFWKPLKPCHVGIHWIALAEYSHMNTHIPGFQSFSGFLHHFVLAKLDTGSIRVKLPPVNMNYLGNHREALETSHHRTSHQLIQNRKNILSLYWKLNFCRNSIASNIS